MDQNNIDTKTNKVEVIHNQDIDNPYFSNQKGFADKLDAERANTASWKFITLVSNVITVIAVIGCIYAANLPNVVPFIFKEDGSGGLTAMGVADEEMHVNKQMVANQIAAFIIGLREIPTSVEIKKRYVTRVEMMSTPALFHNVLANMFKEEYSKAGAGEVTVTLKSIIPLSNNTWELDWVETSTDGTTNGSNTDGGANGGSNSTKLGEYKATLSIELSKEFKNSSALIYNPLGLVVTDININKVIGS